MIFHTIQAKPSMLATGHRELELKTRVVIVAMWLLMTLILVALSLVAFHIGWSAGATQIVGIAAAAIGTGGLGIILGERGAAKAAGMQPATKRKGVALSDS
jgi:hypothetical protein